MEVFYTNGSVSLLSLPSYPKLLPGFQVFLRSFLPPEKIPLILCQESLILTGRNKAISSLP